MPAIDPDRLLGDLYKLRTFGTYKTGVHRPSLSPDDVASRQWLAERMTEAGLDAQIDGIGNVFGMTPRARAARCSSGSHIESQNQAGWLDGALGVIFALEASRAMRESGGGGGVDVIAFFDEEGHFGSYLGSRSFIGDVTEPEIDKARDRTHGKPLREALAEAGYAGRPRLHDRSGALRRILRGAHRAGRQPRSRQAQDRRRHRDRRPVGLSHQGDRRAEPRRHHHDEAAPRRRHDAGPADRGDRPRRSARSPARARCGPAAAWSSSPARRASFRAKRARCSSSATPIRTMLRAPGSGAAGADRRRSTATGRARSRSTSSGRARRRGCTRTSSARSMTPPRGMRRGSRCACRPAPATTRSTSRACFRRR